MAAGMRNIYDEQEVSSHIPLDVNGDGILFSYFGCTSGYTKIMYCICHRIHWLPDSMSR